MDMIVDVNSRFGPLPAAASDLSVDDLMAMMRQHSLRACCTLSTVGMLLDHNMGNAATRAACSEHPELMAVATVNPQAYYGGDGAWTNLRGAGFRMVRLFPAFQKWDPGYAAFIALANDLAADGLPMMVDIASVGEASRVVTSLGRYPGTVILAGVTAQTMAEAIALMRANPAVSIETSRLLATGALKHVVGCVGAERVFFGSGAPAQPMASSLSIAYQSGLTADELAQVLGGNAARLFGL